MIESTRFFAASLRPVAAVLLLLAVIGIGAQAQTQQADYVVGAQDVLAIQVFDQADLGGRFPVETDGSLSFPLIGRVSVGGLTLREVEKLLRERLADGYFKNPQVSVAVEQYRSQRVFIVGEVRSPGTYPLTGDMTLIEALSKAGSTTQTAAGVAVVVRPKSGKEIAGPVMPEGENSADVTNVDIRALQSGRLSQNVILRDGDTIYVPQAEQLYVFGQVRSPGSYIIQRETTVLQALSLAGGVTDRGATGRIRIVRMVDGKKIEVKATLSDPVKPGDTVIVPERFF